MKKNNTDWLKRMENGTVGEATAKEFLIDRFWILERSVDIQGADLIIQRRLTHENILDKRPPIFGVVQVKYFQDDKTTQYIHKEYIIDETESVRKDFFVFIVSGREDKKRTFLLTSEMIHLDFDLCTSKTNYNKYALTGKKALTERYEIKNKKSSLDMIENTLNLSSFEKNRRFFSHYIPSNQINTEISTPYIINVANNHANFKRWQNEIKDKLSYLIIELENTIDLLNEALKESDPIKIEKLLKKIDYDGSETVFFRLEIDSNFFEEVKNYKEKYDDLQKNGILQNFIALQNEIYSKINNFNFKENRLTNEDIIIIEITASQNLNENKINLKIENQEELNKGNLKYYHASIIDTDDCIKCGLKLNYQLYEKRDKNSQRRKEWKEKLENEASYISMKIMNFIYLWRL